MSLLNDLNRLLPPAKALRSLDSLIHELLLFAIEQFRPARGYFALLSGNRLVFPARLDAQGRQIPAPNEENTQFILEQVVRPGQRVSPFVQNTGDRSQAVACVPLTCPSGILGALYLEYPPDALKFAEEKQEDLIFFGRYAAALIASEERGLQAESEFGARQRAENEVRVWKHIIQAWPGSVLITDPEGRVISSNPHFSKVSGYGVEEIRRQPISILKSENTPDETFAEMWEAVQSGHTWQGEFCNRRKDGSLYWVSAIVGPVLDGQGRISHFFSLQQEIDREKAMQEAVERLSVTDPLTGVLNRGHLFTIGEQQLREAVRYDHPLTLLVVDVNHMRLINERFGHLAGDQVLRAIADLLNQNLREADVLGRLSGEEFCVLMPFTPLQDAAQVADRLRQQTANLVVYTASGSVRFTICVGLAAAAPDYTFSQMLEKAEQALKVAKQTEA